jgi:hypothetical protein
VKLRAGQTLHSAVDATTVVVIRAPDDDVSVTCGGQELLEAAPAQVPASEGGAAGDGAQLGKRYADEAVGIELLCTKTGGGALAVNGNPLPLKEAKPLPASD